MNPRKPDPIDILVGQKIKHRRLLKGLTQQKISDVLGITFQQLQKYEKGTNRVSASRLYHMAKILECPIGYFFEETDRELPEKLNKGHYKLITLYGKLSPENRELLNLMASALSENIPEKKDDE